MRALGQERAARFSLRSTTVLVLAVFGVAGFWFLRSGQDGARPGQTATRDGPAESAPPRRELPPGRLLLAGDDSVYVVGDGIEDVTELPADLAGFELSPDGTQALAARFQREPTGIIRHTELVAVDVETGELATLAGAGPKEDVGPAVWSPDGRRVAYRMTTYERDPAIEHPHGHGQRSALCVAASNHSEVRCFPPVGRVDGFAWSPDGAALVVDVVGPEPLWILEVHSGQVHPIGGPGEPWLRQTGTSGRLAGFFYPSWSPSGRYIAAVADFGLRRLVVFDQGGRLVFAGHPFTHVFAEPVWSPADDVVAYASVTGSVGERRLGLDTLVRLLDVTTEREQLVRSFRGYPLVYGVEWDPTGLNLAVLLYDAGREYLSILDIADSGWSRVTLRHSLDALLDWGP